MESVLAALPEAAVASYNAEGLSPAVAMAQALVYFTGVYANAKPKLVIVLGDRYETLAAALAAKFARVPIAHIHGGETTTGAFDDATSGANTAGVPEGGDDAGAAAQRVLCGCAGVGWD